MNATETHAPNGAGKPVCGTRRKNAPIDARGYHTCTKCISTLEERLSKRTQDLAKGKARVQEALSACGAAEDRLLTVVREELDKAARRAGLDEMKMIGTTYLFRDGVEIDIGKDEAADEVREIESLYYEQVPVGFEGLWSAAKGWYA